MRKVLALFGVAGAVAGLHAATAARTQEQVTPVEPEQVSPPTASRPRPALPP